MDAILVEETSSSKAGAGNCFGERQEGPGGLESQEWGRALGLKRQSGGIAQSQARQELWILFPEGDRRKPLAVLSRREKPLGCLGFQDAGREVHK